MAATRCSVVLSAKALDNPRWDALAASRPFAACHPKGWPTNASSTSASPRIGCTARQRSVGPGGVDRRSADRAEPTSGARPARRRAHGPAPFSPHGHRTAAHAATISDGQYHPRPDARRARWGCRLAGHFSAVRALRLLRHGELPPPTRRRGRRGRCRSSTGGALALDGRPLRRCRCDRAGVRDGHGRARRIGGACAPGRALRRYRAAYVRRAVRVPNGRT